jgi:hypothetical protein
MSIKKVWVDKLKDKFLLSTEKYKSFGVERNKFCKEMVKIIENYSLKEIPSEEFKVLKNLSGFWEFIRIYPGTSFRDIFGGDIRDPEIERKFDYWYAVDLKVTKPFYDRCYDNSIYRIRKLPPEILPELIRINNEIMDLDYKKTYLNQSWDRLINSRTKRTWLKINFPKIYEQLKDYETSVSV